MSHDVDLAKALLGILKSEPVDDTSDLKRLDDNLNKFFGMAPTAIGGEPPATVVGGETPVEEEPTAAPRDEVIITGGKDPLGEGKAEGMAINRLWRGKIRRAPARRVEPRVLAAMHGKLSRTAPEAAAKIFSEWGDQGIPELFEEILRG